MLRMIIHTELFSCNLYYIDKRDLKCCIGISTDDHHQQIMKEHLLFKKITVSAKTNIDDAIDDITLYADRNVILFTKTDNNGIAEYVFKSDEPLTCDKQNDNKSLRIHFNKQLLTPEFMDKCISDGNKPELFITEFSISFTLDDSTN